MPPTSMCTRRRATQEQEVTKDSSGYEAEPDEVPYTPGNLALLMKAFLEK